MRAPPSVAFLPTPGQELLLKACLLEGDAALASWGAWRAKTDLDTLDGGSIRLVPLLAARLKAWGAHDAQIGIYRGVQRRTWAKNHLLFRGVRSAMAALRDAAIPFMLLKGAVLATSYYPDPSLRPMGDVDLIVRCRDVFDAIKVLEPHGWLPHNGAPRDAACLAVQNETALSHRRDGNAQIDLHWRLLHTRWDEEAERELWAHAVGIEFEGMEVLSPSPADLLLHVCAHGAMFNSLPPIRWVADAVIVMRAGAIDWKHLVEQCRRLRLALPVGMALGYLHDVMRQPVPGSAIEALAADTPTPIERMLFELEQKPLDHHLFGPQLLMHLHVAKKTLGSSPLAYFRYFNRLRAGRSAPDTLRWLSQRIVRGLGT